MIARPFPRGRVSAPDAARRHSSHVSGSYLDGGMAGHEAITIGIEQFPDPRELRLDHMMAQPFRGQVGGYPTNREVA
jgi:hypothetical protein